MNIFEFAREKEKAAEKTYLELAESAGNKGLKTIFTMLAQMERKHFEDLGRLEKSQTCKIIEFHPLKKVKDEFLKMQTDKEKFKVAGSQVNLYKMAQDNEKEAEKLYLEKAKEATDENLKKILFHMAEEEHKHFIVLENIIEFVQGPSDYLENAEFNNLEKD